MRRQEAFQSLTNTLWFTLVTITTVGYGDMVPLNVVSRIITAGLMMVGIGILGLLTATLLKKLLMGGQVSDKRALELHCCRISTTWIYK